MNKKLYVSKRVKGIDARIDYYLTESRYKDVKEGICTHVYGVGIEKVMPDEFNVENVQKKHIADLSVSREKVIEFLYMLAENDVLPVSLSDIAEDFAGEGFFLEIPAAEKIA